MDFLFEVLRLTSSCLQLPRFHVAFALAFLRNIPMTIILRSGISCEVSRAFLGDAVKLVTQISNVCIFPAAMD